MRRGVSPVAVAEGETHVVAGTSGFDWIVTQIGARELYAVPRSFQRRGTLARLYTDAWCRFAPGLMARLPGRLGALGGRHHPGLPSDKVVSFTTRTLWREATRGRVGSQEEQFGLFLEIGQWFGDAVRRAL